MIASKNWWQVSVRAGRDWLRPVSGLDGGPATLPPALVPIRSLGPRYRGRILAHLLALSPADRYLRFGYAATDEQIARYTEALDFDRDEIFGIYNRKLELIAVAHLAYGPGKGSAEFGVSVAPRARGRGYGARLFRRAVMHARNAGVGQLVVHALSENAAMLKIARRAGAEVHRAGSEAEAYLTLPPADFDSRVGQIVADQVGEFDYRLKRQAKQFRDVLDGVQEVRQGVRHGRHRSGQ